MKLGIILISLLLIGCFEPSKYDKWVYSQETRCIAAGGTSYRNLNEFECWRHPLVRHAKIVFKSKFEDDAQ